MTWQYKDDYITGRDNTYWQEIYKWWTGNYYAENYNKLNTIQIYRKNKTKTKNNMNGSKYTNKTEIREEIGDPFDDRFILQITSTLIIVYSISWGNL